MTITLTKSENQKINFDGNMTVIDLRECEALLRNHYNKYNKTIYMKKIDIILEGMKIPKIEYDVYYNNGSSLVKLNLSSICDKSIISLSMPVSLSKSENLDELNSTSKYYNDICYIATSEN